MRAAREFPANPHALVIHTTERLTERIVETYTAVRADTPAWAAAVVSVPGVRVLSVNTYKLRVQKHKDRAWNEVLEPVEAAVQSAFDLARIEDLVEEGCRRRSFCWHGDPFARAVFEGRAHGREHPLAGALFELDGVAEVILDAHTVQVRRGPLFGWETLADQIEARIAAART